MPRRDSNDGGSSHGSLSPTSTIGSGTTPASDMQPTHPQQPTKRPRSRSHARRGHHQEHHQHHAEPLRAMDPLDGYKPPAAYLERHCGGPCSAVFAELPTLRYCRSTSPPADGPPARAADRSVVPGRRLLGGAARR